MARPPASFDEYWQTVEQRLGPAHSETGSLLRLAYKDAAQQAWQAALSTLDRVHQENDTLRALLPKLPGVKCPYCGLEEIGQCSRGFPGCSWADDLLCGDDEVLRRLLREVRIFNSRTDPCLTWPELEMAAQRHSLEAVRFVDKVRRYAPLHTNYRR